MGEKLKYGFYIALFTPLAMLPLGALYVLSDFLYLIIYKLFKYRIKIVRENLKNSFPDESAAGLLAIEKEFYHHICDNIVETLKLLHISDREVDRRVLVDGGELVEEIGRQGRPVVVFLGHYGNWEWVPAVTRHFTVPAVSSQIYKPLRDKAFDRVMLKIRSRFNTESIPQKKAFRALLGMRRDYRTFLVGFIADHRSNSSLAHHQTTFLHQNTSFNVGGEEIGDRVDAGYLYLDVVKLRRGYYRMTFRKMEPMDDGLEYPYTRRYMQLLETSIQNNPPYWLWSHRRWLYSKK